MKLQLGDKKFDAARCKANKVPAHVLAKPETKQFKLNGEEKTLTRSAERSKQYSYFSTVEENEGKSETINWWVKGEDFFNNAGDVTIITREKKERPVKEKTVKVRPVKITEENGFIKADVGKTADLAQRNDSIIVAIAAMFGLGYSRVLELFEKLGRKAGKNFTVSAFVEAIAKSDVLEFKGLVVEKFDAHAKTVRELLSQSPQGKNLVVTNAAIYAIVDGKVIAEEFKPTARIQAAYSVIEPEAAQIGVAQQQEIQDLEHVPFTGEPGAGFDAPATASQPDLPEPIEEPEGEPVEEPTVEPTVEPIEEPVVEEPAAAVAAAPEREFKSFPKNKDKKKAEKKSAKDLFAE